MPWLKGLVKVSEMKPLVATRAAKPIMSFRGNLSGLATGK